MENNASTEEIFTAFTILSLLAALPLTWIIVKVLLNRYGKAVLKSMMNNSGEELSQHLETGSSNLKKPEKDVEFLLINDYIGHAEEQWQQIKQEQKGIRNKHVLVYGIATIIHALIMASVFNDLEMSQIHTGEIPFLFLLMLYGFWGFYLLSKLIFVKGWKVFLLNFGFWILTFPFENEANGNLPLLFFMMNLIPLSVYAVFQSRKLKAIGPFLYVFVLLFLLGLSLPIIMSTYLFEMMSEATVGGILVFSVPIFIWVTYRLSRFAFRQFVRFYEKKLISDWMSRADVAFLVFHIWHVVIILDTGYWWAIFAMALFPLHKLIVHYGYKLIGDIPGTGSSLLLLRVFGFQNRSESLLDNFSFYWRFKGPINLIAAPDLTTVNIDPHEIYYYLKGKITEQFIKTQEELEDKLNNNDIHPDPDGRFRINEFFCYDNTWKNALQGLLKNSEIILMDLRSFSEQKQGCLFEIGQLLNFVPLSQILFIIDNTTDVNYLKQSISTIWETLSDDSPNQNMKENQIRLFTTSYFETNPFKLAKLRKSWKTIKYFKKESERFFLFSWISNLFNSFFYNRNKELNMLTAFVYQMSVQKIEVEE